MVWALVCPTIALCLCFFKQLPSLSLNILTSIAAQEDKPVQGKAGATGELAQVLVQDHTAARACLHTGQQAFPFPSWAKCPGCQQEEWLKDGCFWSDMAREMGDLKDAHNHWLPPTVMLAAALYQLEQWQVVRHLHKTRKAECDWICYWAMVDVLPYIQRMWQHTPLSWPNLPVICVKACCSALKQLYVICGFSSFGCFCFVFMSKLIFCSLQCLLVLLH